MSLVKELTATLNKMVNDQFETPEVKHFLSVPLTMERGRFFVVLNAHYTANRRDCWGYVQGAAPLEVKKLIWQHESDELVNDPRCNMDHFSLSVKQGEVLGLTGGGGGPRPAGPPPGAGAGGPPGGFTGAPIEQVAVLMLLHATVALVCVGLLTTLARARTVRN